jgi:hypothetical protein
MRPSSFALLPFSVCLLISIGLWFYAGMREEYTMILDVPLEVRLPAQRTLETPIPSAIRTRIQGAGWQLLNINLSSPIRCVIMLSDKLLSTQYLPTDQSSTQESTSSPTTLKNNSTALSSSVTITKLMLTQGLQVPAGIAVLDVMAEPFTAMIGTIEQKKVPIVPILNIQPREGFMLLGIIAIRPDSVTLRSNRRTLSTLSSWRTKPIDLVDVYEPITVQAPLADSLAGIVRLPPIFPAITLNIQQMAEYTFDDIPVRLVSAPTKHRISLQPRYVSVTVRGGVGHITSLSTSDISVVVDYSDAIASATGLVKPRITLPPDITLAQMRPERLHCVSQQRQMRVSLAEQSGRSP